MENSFKNLLSDAKNVLIMLPDRPFFDQVAAGLALYLALKEEKNASISSSSEMTVEFNRLIGVNKIGSSAGNKNLLITFPGYDVNGIERVTYDVDEGLFKLWVFPKPNVSPPQEDEIKTQYSGISADLILLVGGANENHFSGLTPESTAGAKVAHIGTYNLSVSDKLDVLSLSERRSSASELVGNLLKEAGYNINQDIATNLLMGMYQGSKNFSDNSVDHRTFELAAELTKIGGSHTPKDKVEKGDFPKGSIPGEKPDKSQEKKEKKTSETNNNKQSEESRPAVASVPKPSEISEEGEDAPASWLEPKIFKSSQGSEK